MHTSTYLLSSRRLAVRNPHGEPKSIVQQQQTAATSDVKWVVTLVNNKENMSDGLSPESRKFFERTKVTYRCNFPCCIVRPIA